MAQASGQTSAADNAALMWYQSDNGRWSNDAQMSALTFHVNMSQPFAGQTMPEAKSP
jgi:hypothetical protein